VWSVATVDELQRDGSQNGNEMGGDVKGVFLDVASVDTGDLDLEGLRQSLDEWAFHPETAAEQVGERIAGHAVVVTNKTMLDRETIAGADALKLICVAATGTNNVDLEAAHARGVVVCNVVRYSTPSVVQHVFALTLALYTRLFEYDRWVREANWQRSSLFCSLDFSVRELAGKTLGVVGYGELGQGVARIAQAFGMQVLIAERPGAATVRPGRLALADLLPQVDVLTLHCPLTDETRGLIGAAELAAMKPDAIVINTARGGIVDESALADALCRGALGGAGMDVLSVEPPRDGNPLLDPDIPNLIVTPHTAWASRESRQRLVQELAENIRAYRAGSPRNVVT